MHIKKAILPLAIVMLLSNGCIRADAEKPKNPAVPITDVHLPQSTIAATPAPVPIPTPTSTPDPGPVALRGFDKLMIVAHGDDELLWGGAHLIADHYYVVCITGKSNLTRAKEFENSMRETGSAYIMFDYPDRKGGKINNWEEEKPQIAADIKNIIDLKPWDLIVTHNPNGEYGHKQHKLVSEIVTGLAWDKNLYYFGIYYRNPSGTPRLDDALFIQKEKLLRTVYRSQYRPISNRWGQMFPYENWIRYEDWAS